MNESVSTVAGTLLMVAAVFLVHRWAFGQPLLKSIAAWVVFWLAFDLAANLYVKRSP